MRLKSKFFISLTIFLLLISNMVYYRAQGEPVQSVAELEPFNYQGFFNELVTWTLEYRNGTVWQPSSDLIISTTPVTNGSKYTLNFTASNAGQYRLNVSILCDYDNMTQDDNRVYLVKNGIEFYYDWNDTNNIALPKSFWLTEGVFHWNIVFTVTKGFHVSVDPVTVAGSVSQYSTYGSGSRKLFSDPYGNLIAVYKDSNVHVGYSNDSGASWVDVDGGATYATTAGVYFGVAAAYNSTQDKLIVGFCASNNIKFAQVTFTRDGSNYITGLTWGSVLTITPTYVVGHNPSLCLMANGEIGAVWGSDKASGAKHSRAEFCRLTFGSPPTYQNGAGSASSTDLLFTDYTSGFTIRFTSIIQRTASGTGQYDIYVFCYLLAADAHVSVKGDHSGGSWSWGSQVSTAAHLINEISTTYDDVNDLIIYCGAYPSNTGLTVGTVSADDTDTDISPSGTVYTVSSPSAVVKSGNIYVFYKNSTSGDSIWYKARVSSSWGSWIQFYATDTNYYPSCMEVVGSSIKLIWTTYVSSVYNVLYSYLTLGGSYSAALSQVLSVSESVAITSTFHSALAQALSHSSSVALTSSFHTALSQSLSLSESIVVGLQYLISLTQGLSYSNSLATVWGAHASLTQGASISESTSLQWIAHVVPDQALILTEGTNIISSFHVAPSQALSLSESVSNIWSATVGLSQSLLYNCSVYAEKLGGIAYNASLSVLMSVGANVAGAWNATVGLSQALVQGANVVVGLGLSVALSMGTVINVVCENLIVALDLSGITGLPLNLMFYAFMSALSLVFAFRPSWIGKFLAGIVFAFLGAWMLNGASLLDMYLYTVNSAGTVTASIEALDMPFQELFAVLNIAVAFTCFASLLIEYRRLKVET